MSGSLTLDLGPSDVHVPSAGSAKPARTKKMAALPTSTRNALPDSSFALPKQRKYPLENAAHVRNAAARLEQEKKVGKVSDAEYGEAKKRIAAAAKKFGVRSKYNAKTMRVRAKLAAGSELHVRHMSDAECVAVLPPVDISATAD